MFLCYLIIPLITYQQHYGFWNFIKTRVFEIPTDQPQICWHPHERINIQQCRWLLSANRKKVWVLTHCSLQGIYILLDPHLTDDGSINGKSMATSTNLLVLLSLCFSLSDDIRELRVPWFYCSAKYPTIPSFLFQGLLAYATLNSKILLVKVRGFLLGSGPLVFLNVLA